MQIPQRKPINPQRPAHGFIVRLPAIRRYLALALLALFTTLPAVAADNERSQPTLVEAEMLDGTPYSLQDSRGAVTVLSIWSPESLASRKCIWELERFAAAYQSRDVRTIAISTLKDPDELRLFIASRKLTLPVAMLGNHNLGRIDEPRLPLVYVFDRDGKLQTVHAGLFSMRALERLVAPQLRQ